MLEMQVGTFFFDSLLTKLSVQTVNTWKWRQWLSNREWRKNNELLQSIELIDKCIIVPVRFFSC